MWGADRGGATLQSGERAVLNDIDRPAAGLQTEAFVSCIQDLTSCCCFDLFLSFSWVSFYSALSGVATDMEFTAFKLATF